MIAAEVKGRSPRNGSDLSRPNLRVVKRSCPSGCRSNWRIMDLSQYAVPIAGCITILIGAGCGVGCRVLWGGKPESWPDFIANDLLIHKVSLGLLIVSALLLAAGIGTLVRISGSREAVAVAILLFVAGGYLGNYKLFGDLRPKHTLANTVIAAVVLWLLWVG